MTLDEAVALLREALMAIRLPCVSGGWPCGCETCETKTRIDAALAAHDAEPEAVEWVEYSDGDLMAYPGDGNILSVRKREDGRWQWNTEIDREDGGFCATVEEAKAAALKAARSAR